MLWNLQAEGSGFSKDSYIQENSQILLRFVTISPEARANHFSKLCHTTASYRHHYWSARTHPVDSRRQRGTQPSPPHTSWFLFPPTPEIGSSVCGEPAQTSASYRPSSNVAFGTWNHITYSQPFLISAGYIRNCGQKPFYLLQLILSVVQERGFWMPFLNAIRNRLRLPD